MKVCPKCKYERTVQDDLLYPDYECPSCGIILEKHKARYEFEKLEKKRAKERKVKREKLKKEAERKRKEEEERQHQEEEARRKREEEERLKKDEEERLRKEEEERQRQEEEARRKKEEEERLKIEKEELFRIEQEEKAKKQKEEKARKKEEEKKRKAEQERIKKEEKTKRFLQERQEKTRNLVRENADKIIASAEGTDECQLFDMCPFAIAQTGKGSAIAGIGVKKNKWQHLRCIRKYCRLWTLKIDGNGEVYARGCSMQFQGLTKEEIVKNFEIKNKQIIEEAKFLDDLSGDTETK